VTSSTIPFHIDILCHALEHSHAARDADSEGDNPSRSSTLFTATVDSSVLLILDADLIKMRVPLLSATSRRL